MRLLNLWPHATKIRTVRSPATRLIQEVLLTLLIVGLLLSGAYAYFEWRIREAKKVNLELQAHVTQLQTNSTDQANNTQITQYLEMRNQRMGQLNWLVELTQLTDAQSQLIQVMQKEDSLLISGRAKTAADAQNVVARIHRAFPKPAPILLSLEAKKEQGVSAWIFAVQASSLPKAAEVP